MEEEIIRLLKAYGFDDPINYLYAIKIRKDVVIGSVDYNSSPDTEFGEDVDYCIRDGKDFYFPDEEEIRKSGKRHRIKNIIEYLTEHKVVYLDRVPLIGKYSSDVTLKEVLDYIHFLQNFPVFQCKIKESDKDRVMVTKNKTTICLIEKMKTQKHIPDLKAKLKAELSAEITPKITEKVMEEIKKELEKLIEDRKPYDTVDTVTITPHNEDDINNIVADRIKKIENSVARGVEFGRSFGAIRTNILKTKSIDDETKEILIKKISEHFKPEKKEEQKPEEKEKKDDDIGIYL